MKKVIDERCKKVISKMLLDPSSFLSLFVQNSNRNEELTYLILKNFIENLNKKMEYLHEDVQVFLDKSQVAWAVYLTRNGEQDKIAQIHLPRRNESWGTKETLVLSTNAYARINIFQKDIAFKVYQLLDDALYMEGIHEELNKKSTINYLYASRHLFRKDDLDQMIKDLNLETLDKEEFLSDKTMNGIKKWLTRNEYFLSVLDLKIEEKMFELKHFITGQLLNSTGNFRCLDDEHYEYHKSLLDYKEDDCAATIYAQTTQGEMIIYPIGCIYSHFFELINKSNIYKYINKLPLLLSIVMQESFSSSSFRHSKTNTLRKETTSESLKKLFSTYPTDDFVGSMICSNRFHFYRIDLVM